MQRIIRHNQKPLFKVSVVLVLLIVMLGVLHVLEEVFEIWTKQAIVDMQDTDIASIDTEHRYIPSYMLILLYARSAMTSMIHSIRFFSSQQ